MAPTAQPPLHCPSRACPFHARRLTRDQAGNDSMERRLAAQGYDAPTEPLRAVHLLNGERLLRSIYSIEIH